MNKIFLLGLVVLLLSSISYAATIECFDDGSIKIDGIKKKWPIQAKEKYGGEDWFDVPGRYIYKGKKLDEYLFFSDEALFVSQEGKKYKVKIGKYAYTLTCPSFKFSCRIFNISVDYCYTRNNTFISKFMVYNFHFNKTSVLRFTKPFMLWYEVKTKDNKRYIHASDRYSPAFKEVNISMRKLNAGSKFFFRWPTEEQVERFFIRYNKCRQERYNFYMSTECTEAISCTIDQDCFKDEYCNERLCVKLDCEECQYIENHTCLNYTCCLNEDCNFSEECVNHFCVELNCSFGEGAIEHACVKCAGDEYVFEYNCLKLECLDAEEAVNHTCQKLNCSWYTKPKEHKCTNLLSYYFRKLFKI